MTIPPDNQDKAFATFGDAAGLLHSLLTQDIFHGVISATDAATMANANGWTLEQLAIALLPFAQSYAIVPISDYKVGAVVIGGSGALYFGANMEFLGEALSFSLHAEQSAIANAWMNGETSARSIGITAAPCGYCRQFLYELIDAKKFIIALPDVPTQLLTYYLPDAFGPGDLGKTGGMMETVNNGLTFTPPDATAKAALVAANMAYSPYTSSFAGVALMTKNAVCVMGAYAENAAFNPSLSPMEIALSQLTFYNQPFDSITEAVLIEPVNSPASQIGASEMVLGTVTNVPVTVYRV